MNGPDLLPHRRAETGIRTGLQPHPAQTGCRDSRFQSTVRILLIGAVVLTASTRLHGQDDLMEEFLQGIANAADALESLQVTAVCRNQVTYETDDPEIRAQIRRNLRNRDQPPEDVFTCVIDGPFTRQEGTKDNLRYVMARNERYAFALTSRDQEQEWSLNWLSECGRSEADDAEIHTREQQARAILLGPYWIMGTPLSEVVASPQFIIKNIERVASDGQERVKVTFEYDFLRQKLDVQFRDAWFLCDPTRNWVVTKLHAVVKEDNGQEQSTYILTIHCMSHVLSSGIPVGIQVTGIVDTPNVFDSPPGSEQRLITRSQATAEIVDDGEASDRSAFYLSYYGLDEPTFQAPWYTSGWVLLVIGGIVTGTGLILLRRFQKQHR